MKILQLENITKTYEAGEGAKPVVKAMSFAVDKGQILVLLGSSGCGKTTTLKMIAGLERQDAGHIYIGGRMVDGIPPEKRPISMVFQKALLFRHLNVEQNVNFGPRVNKTMSKKELAARTEELLELIDMAGMGKRRATELSGGQEQRVSLARALMVDPDVLLLDEPLSALDAQLRVNLRREIKRINRATGKTMVFVTHDQQEAVEVADKIILMGDGSILQEGAPRDFYTTPRNLATAEFFGWRNFIPASKRGGVVSCALGGFPAKNPNVPDGNVVLCIRPEAIRLTRADGLSAKVVHIDSMGVQNMCALQVGDVELIVQLRAFDTPPEGETLTFDIDKEMVCEVSAS